MKIISKVSLLIMILNLYACSVTVEQPIKRQVLSDLPTDNALMEKGIWLDKRTGLMWSRCLVGQKYQDGTCEGNVPKKSYDNLVKEMKDGYQFGGFSDWRLPTISELEAIRQCDVYLDAETTIPTKDGKKHVPERCAVYSDDTVFLDKKIFPIKPPFDLASSTFVGGIQKAKRLRDYESYGMLYVYYLGYSGYLLDKQPGWYATGNSAEEWSSIVVRGGDNSEHLQAVQEVMKYRLPFIKQRTAAWSEKEEQKRQKETEAKSKTLAQGESDLNGKEAFLWMMGKVAKYAGLGGSSSSSYSSSSSSSGNKWKCTLKCTGNFGAVGRSTVLTVPAKEEWNARDRALEWGSDKNFCDGATGEGTWGYTGRQMTNGLVADCNKM